MTLRVALTGGVGSGKSTVAARFTELGALVIDADAIAREVVEPGTPGLTAVVAHFGADVLTPEGRLDRPKLASIVFEDETQRRALNEIVHPLIGQRVAQLADAADPDAVVVYDVPLLVETNPDASGFDAVVVVDASLSTRLERLAGRGMAEQDARERIAAQATDEQRRAVADEVVDNDGDLAMLRSRVDEVWGRLVAAGDRGAAAGDVRRPDPIG